ncbi:hypothetical protein LEP1GSC171_0290 [Leptospira santarosai str. HAI1380]|nr:hypothetical protein LEP1GSC171_0290 [Leptospira santarosai str. HAI1380]
MATGTGFIDFRNIVEDFDSWKVIRERFSSSLLSCVTLDRCKKTFFFGFRRIFSQGTFYFVKKNPLVFFDLAPLLGLSSE